MISSFRALIIINGDGRCGYISTESQHGWLGVRGDMADFCVTGCSALRSHVIIEEYRPIWLNESLTFIK